MNIVAMEIRTKNMPGGLARGGYLLHVIYNNTSQFLGFVDYEDVRNYIYLRDKFTTAMIYLGWIDVEVKQWQGYQRHRPGKSGMHSLNRWQQVADAIAGN